MPYFNMGNTFDYAEMAYLIFPRPFIAVAHAAWRHPETMRMALVDITRLFSPGGPAIFKAERGHHDQVSRDRLVAYEYAKVLWLYTQFGLADKTRMEYFNGGHTINGQGTFEFLAKHLAKSST
jgi:hypothetical protein